MQVLERAQADMLNTKAAADTARLELARNLTCLESRKRYAFLEALVSVMHSHLKFFQNGFDVLRKLEPVLHQAQVRGRWSRQDVSQAAAWPDKHVCTSCTASGRGPGLHQRFRKVCWSCPCLAECSEGFSKRARTARPGFSCS